MKKYADKGKRPLVYQVGDRAMLKFTTHIWKKIKVGNIKRALF